MGGGGEAGGVWNGGGKGGGDVVECVISVKAIIGVVVDTVAKRSLII